MKKMFVFLTLLSTLGVRLNIKVTLFDVTSYDVTIYGGVLVPHVKKRKMSPT